MVIGIFVKKCHKKTNRKIDLKSDKDAYIAKDAVQLYMAKPDLLELKSLVGGKAGMQQDEVVAWFGSEAAATR